MMPNTFRKLLWLWLILVAASCDLTREESPTPDPTVSWSPRLTDAQGGANVPKVDRIQLLITLNDGSNRSFNQSAYWSSGSIKIDGIPANVPFTATVKGLMNDGSLVWSGNSQVGAGGGSAELTSAVAVTPTVGAGIKLDSAALRPTGSQLARVYVTNWPFADNSLRLLYTTDGSDPMPSNGSTRTYVGPFTLSGSGKLRLRQYRDGNVGVEAISSAILEQSYQSLGWQGCSLPDFSLPSGAVGGTTSMNVNLGGSTNVGCELHYRLDGIAPTLTDPVWTATGIALGNGTTHVTLKALSGSAAAMVPSPVAEGSWLCSSCITTVSALQIVDSTGSAILDRYPMGNGLLRLEARYGTVPVGSAVWNVASQPSGSTFVLNSGGASAWFLPSQDGDYELHAKVGQDLAITRVHWSGLVGAVVMAAMGNQTVAISAGTQAQLNVSISGAIANTSVVWNIENAGMGSLTPTGTSCSYQAQTGLAAAAVTYVRATLWQNGAATTQSVLFTVNVQPIQNPSLSTAGSLTIPLNAGQSTQLNVTASGIAVPSISWNIENAGMGSITPNGSSCTYYAPTSVPASASVQVRATLAGTTQSLLFTINIQPTVETIASSGATAYDLAPEERKQLMVTTVPTNAAVQWALVGTSTGAIDPYGFYSYYQAPTVAELGTTRRQMTVRASLVSDPSRFVDFLIDVQSKPLVFRDNDAKEDTNYAVPSGTASFYLEAWKGTARATGAKWTLIDKPATAVLPTWTTDANGSILFNATQDGVYRFQVVDGGYVSTVAIRWGLALSAT